MTNLFILFVIGPLVTALALLALTGRHRWQQALSAGALAGLLGFAGFGLIHVYGHGIVVLKMGDWDPPFGITLVADILSMTMVVLCLTIAFASVLFSLGTVDRDRERHFFYPLFFILITGINGAFLTGDIFNLFVFFEVLLIASYALMVLGSEADQLRETIKYLVINLVASTFFLIGPDGAIELTSIGFDKWELNRISQRVAEHLGEAPQAIAGDDDGNPRFKPG